MELQIKNQKSIEFIIFEKKDYEFITKRLGFTT